jgi:hypothetical protein
LLEEHLMEIFTAAIAAALGNLGSAAVLGAYQAKLRKF